MTASEVGSFDCVQILVENESSLDIVDISNNNAADLAQINGHGGIAEFLREKLPGRKSKEKMLKEMAPFTKYRKIG